ncbi:amino acid adenylation domain-containing protein [Streptomyces sp. NPDC054796]
MSADEEAHGRGGLSSAQWEVWLGHELDATGALWNIAQYCDIPAAIDTGRFADAVAQVVAETDALHTGVAVRDGLPYPVSGPPHGWSLETLDLSTAPDPHGEAVARMEADVTEPVDLAAPPLFRYVLIKLSDDRYLWYLRHHHVHFDAFSMWLVARRVSHLYRAAGTPEGRLEPTATLLRHENAYRASPHHAEDRAYWLDRLTGTPEPTGPAGRRADPVPGQRTAQVTLSRDVMARLRAAAAGRTSVDLLTACLGGHLARVTGSEDVLLDFVVSGRTDPATRRTPGMAANRLPLRLAVRAGEAFSTLVGTVSDEIRSLMRHSAHPGQELRHAVRPGSGRIAHAGPVVNFLLFDYDAVRFEDRAVRCHYVRTGPVADLHVNITRSQGEFHVEFAGNPQLYSDRDLEGHAEAFRELVESVADAPERAVVSRSVPVRDSGQDTVHDTGHGTGPGVPAATWPALFEAQAARTPGATAVSCASRSLSYAELDARADALAHHLTGLGVGPGDLVAIACEPSADMVTAVLAVMKSGAAYVPLDAAHPAARTRFVAHDCAPAGLLTDQEPTGGLAAYDWDWVLPAPSWPRTPPSEAPGARRRRPLTPDSPAYVIYTSGSTGVPKGVCVSHRGIASLVAAQRERLALTARSRILQFASLTFDASVFEMCMALLTGATLVLAGRERTRPGDDLVRLVDDEGITHLTLPPSALAVLPPDTMPGLESVVVAGEPCPGALAERWSRGRRLINAYGPTEATVCVTMSRPLSGPDKPPIGTPVTNARTYVLDGRREPVATGATGELYVGGPGLALGYLNRPDLTRERFVPDPFAPGALMYRTGDLVRTRPDGQLEYVGRADHQVKVRGHRIEPGEIEETLCRHPAIARAAVLVREDDGTPRLAAYAQPAAGAAPSAADLRAHLKEALPAYLVPDLIDVVGRMPLTANGKTDHAALRALPPPSCGTAVPRTPQEHTLCSVFAEVLGRDRVGVDDDFFTLGGTSLRAVELIRRIRTTLGTQISMRTLFDAPTVAALAAGLGIPTTPEASLDVLLPLRPHGSRAPLFCVHPALGLSWGYAGLARHLADRPLYGLQARALTAPGTPGSVEAMATDYLREIRRIQPTGPYHLLGWSFGGRVAFEMARQVREAGESVGLLALLDSNPPPARSSTVSTDDFVREDAITAYFLTMLSELDPAEAARTVERAPDLDALHARLVALGSPYALLERHHFHRMFDLHRDHYVLSRKYVPATSFDGDVAYFSASQDAPSGRTHENWQPFVDGKVTGYPIACRHLTMTGPAPLAAIGDVLRDLLQDR